MKNTDIAVSNSLTDLRERLKNEHAAVASAFKTSLQHAMAAGDILIEAKAQLKHGQWLSWLQACELPERRAQRYIRLAKNRPTIEANPTPVSDLGIVGALAILTVPHDDVATELSDAAADMAFEHWDIVVQSEQSESARVLAAEAMAALDRIIELEGANEIVPENEMDFFRQFMAAIDEWRVVQKAETEPNAPWNLTPRRKVRDITVKWLQHVEGRQPLAHKH